MSIPHLDEGWDIHELILVSYHFNCLCVWHHSLKWCLYHVFIQLMSLTCLHSIDVFIMSSINWWLYHFFIQLMSLSCLQSTDDFIISSVTLVPHLTFYIYIYIYLWICLCMCMYVCMLSQSHELDEWDNDKEEVPVQLFNHLQPSHHHHDHHFPLIVIIIFIVTSIAPTTIIFNIIVTAACTLPPYCMMWITHHTSLQRFSLIIFYLLAFCRWSCFQSLKDILFL